jgi:hypothetical protein
MVIIRLKQAATILVLTTGLGGLGNAALAEQHEGCDPDPAKLEQTGTVKGHMTSIGFIAGARWGDGVLSLQDGTARKFKILGLKVVETGVAANDFEGEVYNLKAAQDFEGTYFGASTKLSVIASKGEGVVNNKRCVVVKVRYSGSGVQLSAPAPGGVEVSFTD